ncbi:MAG: hypothetical protein E7667_02240 [Ruminococcaceae bacterium]|nr:hypothetical protein [Oscillospiraceae bacterium]
MVLLAASLLFVMCSCGKKRWKLHEHQYTSWQTDTHPTCQEDGTFIRNCTICGQIDKMSTPALGHSYDDGVEISSPTCTERGYTEHTCKLCGNVKSVVTSKASHEPKAAFVITEQHHAHECSNCGALVNKEEHFYQKGVCIICNAVQSNGE